MNEGRNRGFLFACGTCIAEEFSDFMPCSIALSSSSSLRASLLEGVDASHDHSDHKTACKEPACTVRERKESVLVLKASMAKTRVKVQVWGALAARADEEALPFCQLSTLFCTLQVAFNDDKLTGNLWVQHSSESQRRRNQITFVFSVSCIVNP